MRKLPETQYWINKDQIHTVETAEYWNDEQSEKSKPFYVTSTDDFSAIEYLRSQLHYRTSPRAKNTEYFYIARKSG